MLDTKTIGDISEAFVVACFLKKGYIVLRPVGDNQRYDLVIDRGNGFERVQVKTARYMKKAEALSIPLSSGYAHRGRPRISYHGEVEIVAAWSHDFGKIYVVELKDMPNATEVWLRLKPAKNNQVKNTRLATDYVFDH